jgi:hypothetical protein
MRSSLVLPLAELSILQRRRSLHLLDLFKSNTADVS